LVEPAIVEDTKNIGKNETGLKYFRSMQVLLTKGRDDTDIMTDLWQS